MLRDSLHTFAARMATMLLALLCGVLTARLLGPAGRGLYVLPVINAEIAAAFLGGLSSATSYYMLSARKGRGVLGPAFFSAAVLTAAGFLEIVALGIWQHGIWSIAPAAMCLLPIALVAIVNGYCYGTHRVRLANRFAVLGGGSVLIFTALGLFLIERSSLVAVLAWLAANVFTAAVALRFLLRDARALPAEPVPLSSYLSFTLKIGATNLVTMLNYRADIYIIAALTSPHTLGIYTLAVSAAEGLKVLTLVLSQSSAPHIGDLAEDESARFTALCMRANIAISILPTLAVILWAPTLLAAFFGGAFAEGASATRILAAGVFIMAPGSLFSAYYTLKLGRPIVSFWCGVIAGAACVVLSFALIPLYGMNGAAAASAGAYALETVYMLYLFSRDTCVPVSHMLVPQPQDAGLCKAALAATLGRLMRRTAQQAG